MDNEFSVRVQSNLNFPKGSPNSYRTCNTNLKKKQKIECKKLPKKNY